MSSDAMKWARRQMIENGPLSRALDVVAQLANGQKGYSLFHSQRTIASRLHCNVRTARRLLDQLERLGIIQRAHRSRGRGQGRTSDLIKLRVDRDFTFTKEQIRTLLQADKIAASKPLASPTYKRTFSHLQAEKMPGHDQLSDQQKKEAVYPREQDLVRGNTHARGGGPRLAVLAGGRA